MMEVISTLTDIFRLRKKLPLELVEYLEEEFIALYHYLSNGESLEDFYLDNQQCMNILQEDSECQKILREPFEVEFVDLIKQLSLEFFRIGIRRAEDIQLYYFMGDIIKEDTMKILNELQVI